MSDTPQGPGWWQASDDKWYPPPRPDMPDMPGGQGGPPTESPPGGQPAEPPPGPPAGPPTGPPVGPPQGPPTGPPMAGGPSPYGVQAGPPGAPTNKAPLFVALVFLGLVAIVGVVVLITSSGDDGDGTDTASTTQPTAPPDTAAPSTADTAPSTTGGGGSAGPGAAGTCDIPQSEVGDGLVISGCGFSTPAYPYEEGSFLPSWGFVVENQGDDAVESAGFSVAMKGEDGTVIGFEEVTIHVLPAGEELGVGFTAFNFDAVDQPLGAVEVTYTGLSEVFESPGEGSLTVSDTTTSVLSESVETTFSVDSTYSSRVDDPATYVIYRNSEGDIIGGFGETLQPDVITPDSSTSVYVENTAVYEDLDPEGTEAYVDHGPSY